MSMNYHISQVGCGWLHAVFVCDNLRKNEQMNHILEIKKKLKKEKKSKLNKNKKKIKENKTTKIDPRLGYFSMLPNVQILYLFTFFNSYSLGKIATCSKDLLYLSSNNIFWETIYQKKLGPPNEKSCQIIENLKYENIGWKKAYFERMKLRRKEPKKSDYLETSFFSKVYNKLNFKKKKIRDFYY
eukprot:Anaeramoba_flamelloidesa330174_17.p1 GENE.a330174_17~~a330174_17.p1  ORF type:complete len:206 (-),score=63.88 a330174_17:562-1116(-)